MFVCVSNISQCYHKYHTVPISCHEVLYGYRPDQDTYVVQLLVLVLLNMLANGIWSAQECCL